MPAALHTAQPPAPLPVVHEVIELPCPPPLTLVQEQPARLEPQPLERRAPPQLHQPVPPAGQRAVPGVHPRGQVNRASADIDEPGQAAHAADHVPRHVDPPLIARRQVRRCRPGGAVGAARDHVDHAAHRFRAVERRLRPLHHLDPLDHRRRDPGEVDGPGEPADEGLPVQEHQHPLEPSPWIITPVPAGCTLDLDPRPLRQHRRQVRRAGLADLAARHQLRRDRHVRQPLEPPPRRDHERAQHHRPGRKAQFQRRPVIRRGVEPSLQRGVGDVLHPQHDPPSGDRVEPPRAVVRGHALRRPAGDCAVGRLRTDARSGHRLARRRVDHMTSTRACRAGGRHLPGLRPATRRRRRKERERERRRQRRAADQPGAPAQVGRSPPSAPHPTIRARFQVLTAHTGTSRGATRRRAVVADKRTL